MKISKPLNTLSEYNDFEVIKDYFANEGIVELSKEELELFRDYFYLLSNGGQTTGAMTEENLSEILKIDEPINETFADDIASGQANALKSAAKTATTIATVLGAAGVAAGGFLYWKLKTRKAKKMVAAENKVKIDISNDRVKAHQDIEANKMAFNTKKEGKTGKDLDRLRKARDKKEEKIEKSREDKEKQQKDYLSKLKEITDDYIKMKGDGKDKDKPKSKNESVNEAISFSGADWIESIIRKLRIKGDIESKKIELAIMTDSEKQIGDEALKKAEKDLQEVEDDIKTQEEAGKNSQSDKEKKAEAEATAALAKTETEEEPKGTDEEPKGTDEEPKKSTGDVEKMKVLSTKIRQLEQVIKDKDFILARVEKVLKKAKDEGNAKVERVASKTINKSKSERQDIYKKISQLKKEISAINGKEK